MFEVDPSPCQKDNLERYDVNSSTLLVEVYITYFNLNSDH